MASFDHLTYRDPLAPARPGVYRSPLAVARREAPKLPELELFASVLSDAIVLERRGREGYAARDDVRRAREWIAGDVGEITFSDCIYWLGLGDVEKARRAILNQHNKREHLKNVA